ncbi:hypothetical protein HK104_008129, partial [Borealophlyctis nickersoniae]
MPLDIRQSTIRGHRNPDAPIRPIVILVAFPPLGPLPFTPKLKLQEPYRRGAVRSRPPQVHPRHRAAGGLDEGFVHATDPDAAEEVEDGLGGEVGGVADDGGALNGLGGVDGEGDA